MSDTNWPTYESHKIVRAMRVSRKVWWYSPAEDVALFLENGEHFVPTVPAMLDKAEPGDYAVIYADGYKSISPKKAFEEGYAKVQS